MKPQFDLKHICLFLAAFILTLHESNAQGTEVDFTTQIRPFLSNNCFHCHGPDEAEREGGLRLDTKAGAFGETDSGEPAIVSGKPEASELLRRLVSGDEYERMPPPESGITLDENTIQMVRDWIAQGANYSGHWAYQKPTQPSLPNVKDSSWSNNEIDLFVQARLETVGLKPQHQAEPAMLLRRVSLDLTGLPPTMEEVQAFQQDPSDQSYEQAVDRLLASPKFGEHWARMWLDLARYADSAGYADDPPRTIWAFRDYVIRSLNENKPFDQFTIEQLAGDLLENPTDEQLVATAFHRNTLTNNEGGTNDEEFRNAAIIDRVNTTFATWMGTTMACAQCHTHKYDPISQQEYFQVFAILNNTEDADKRDESPLLEYFTPELRERREELAKEIEKLNQELLVSTPKIDQERVKWEAELQTPLHTQLGSVSNVQVEPKAEVSVADGVTVAIETNAEQQTVNLDWTPSAATKSIQALRLNTLPLNNANFVLTNVSAVIKKKSENSTSARFLRVELPGKSKMLSLAEMQVFSGGKNIAAEGKAKQSSTDYSGPAELAIDGNTNGDYHNAKSTTHTMVSDNPWWELDFGKNRAIDSVTLWNRTDNNLQSRLNGAQVSLLDENRNVVWKESLPEAPEKQIEWNVIYSRRIQLAQAFADYEQSGFPAPNVFDKENKEPTGWAVGGQTDRAHELVMTFRKPIQLAEDEKLVLTLEQKSQYKEHVLRQFRLEAVVDPRVSKLAQLSPEIRKILSITAAERNDEQAKQLREYFSIEVASAHQAQRIALKKAKSELSSLKALTTVPIMKELATDKQRKTHIQIRGNFMSLGDEVGPGLPEVFQIPTAETPSRLELAQWLIDDQNPLTARVIANRYWEKLFGIGLVSTSEEFGSQGELPSHPKLLDWLAIRFIDLGWNNKALLKEIVMSAAYRQTSQVTPELLEADPDNRLISRGPRFRLSAEMVRDQALAVSGLLSDKMYGAPVKPPQPDIGLKAAFGGGIDWQTSKGEDRYRRGLYTTWRRSNPYPSMAAFDAPNRETCTLKRDRTNTPLQAFVTLNDPVYIEAAQSFGRRMAAQEGTVSEKLAWGMQTALARTPTSEEVDRLVKLLEATQEHYQSMPDQARIFATDPLGELPEGADPAEYAAWTLVGNVILNLDEFLMKP